MCFTRDYVEPKKTGSRGIRCFKLLKRQTILGHPQKRKYLSLHFYHEWETGKTYIHYEGPKFGPALPVDITDQAFHSYRNKRRARMFFRDSEDMVMVECRIPPNTEYYSDSYEYASRALKLVGLVKNKK